MISVQYIRDEKGKEKYVQIPVKDWKNLKKRYSDLEAQEYSEPTKLEILDGIKEALEEVKLAQKGKLKLQSMKTFLNEL